LVKDGMVKISDLPAALHVASSAVPAPAATAIPTLGEHEKMLLQEALQECGWNKKQAAKRLGISRSTLYEKLKKYQISKPTAH
jgi:two-component system response regulator HydG